MAKKQTSSGPLSGRSIVVARAEAQAVPLIEALEAEGADVVPLPMIEVVFAADDERELRAAIDTLEGSDWVVFTSANAVAACVAAGILGWLDTVRVAAIGSATSRALDDVGVHVDFVPPEATAASLAENLPSGGRALLPLAELAADTLETGLVARGFETTRLTAYRTAVPEHEATQLDEARNADLILATAPSIVDRLVRQLGIDGIPEPLICIGPSTAAAAERHGLDVVVASPHNDEGLVVAASQTLTDLR